jgi:hypothetical protein
MATWSTVCEVMSGLPGAVLDDDVAHPAWRVNDRVLARRNPRVDAPEPGEVIAVRVDPAERSALLAEDPASFFLTDHWAKSRNPSILVRLASVDDSLLRELLVEAWRRRATKRQRAALE